MSKFETAKYLLRCNVHGELSRMLEDHITMDNTLDNLLDEVTSVIDMYRRAMDELS